MLFQAQGEAASGQTDGALRTIALIQAALDDIVARCEATPAAPAAPLSLNQTYVSEAGGFSVRFPEGWMLDERDFLELGIRIAAGWDSRSDPADMFSINPTFLPGDRALAAFVVDISTMTFTGVDPDAPVSENVALIADFFNFMLQPEQQSLRDVTIDGQVYSQLWLSNADLDLVVLGYDFEPGRFVTFVGMTGPGEGEGIIPVLEAFAGSFAALEDAAGAEGGPVYVFDANNVSFEYPATWVAGDPGDLFDFLGDVVLFGTSEEAAAKASALAPSLAPGEQAAMIAVGDFSSLGVMGYTPDMSPEETFTQVMAFFEENLGVTITRAPALVTGDMEMYSAVMAGPAADGVYVAVDISAGRYALFSGFSAPGETDALEDVLIAMARSLEVGP